MWYIKAVFEKNTQHPCAQNQQPSRVCQMWAEPPNESSELR